MDDVERILATYWLRSSISDHSADGPNDAATPASNLQAAAKSKARRTPYRLAAGEPASRGNALDAEQLANDIKGHPAFVKIKSKVLDVKGDWISKCKMVALIANAPITSGDVSRVLAVLRVKTSLPRLSEALSANSSDFLTRGASPVRYTMTSVAEDAFKAWLAETAKEAA